MTWYERSIAVIEEAYHEHRKSEEELGGGRLSDDDVLKLIRRRDYPFGPREHWPYKVWLRAIRDWRDFLARRGRLYRIRFPQGDPDPDQIELF